MGGNLRVGSWAGIRVDSVGMGRECDERLWQEQAERFTTWGWSLLRGAVVSCALCAGLSLFER